MSLNFLAELYIFDLDGTLLDTVYDIGDSMNQVLSEEGLPTHSYQAYRTFIGDGLRSLTEKALGPSFVAQKKEEEIDHLFQRMRHVYRQNLTHKTKPYAGIMEVLKHFRNQGIKMAMLSNKADDFTQILAQHFFENYFERVMGSGLQFKKKPDPAAALFIAQELGIQASRCVIIGDTASDILAAKNAGMLGVGVSWGFRSRQDLEKAGAHVIFDHPRDLLTLCETGFTPPKTEL